MTSLSGCIKGSCWRRLGEAAPGLSAPLSSTSKPAALRLRGRGGPPETSAHLQQLLLRQLRTQVQLWSRLSASLLVVFSPFFSFPDGAVSRLSAEPVVRLNTWVVTDSSHTSLPVTSSPRLGDDVYLEEVQTDEDKLSCGILSSDSTFLPFTSDLDPQGTRSESEDETETFEPDSLAPKWPAHPANTTNKPCSLPLETEEKTPEDEVVTSAAVPTTPLEVGDSSSQKDPETTADVGEAEGEPPLEKGTGAHRAELMHAHEAAIKIQSWWRGQRTRSCHPAAREVRSEIRLRRMQEHIVYLSEKLQR